MEFQKTFIRASKIFNLVFGSYFMCISIATGLDWLRGSNSLTLLFLKTGKKPELLGILLLGYISYILLSEFFYFRKKLIVGFNDDGICVYNQPTKSYIFIDWVDLQNTSVSYGLGGRIGINPEGLIIFHFKRARLYIVDKKSSYINSNGDCLLHVIKEQEYYEDSCAVDFGYWSWQPYAIKKEVKKRMQFINDGSYL